MKWSKTAVLIIVSIFSISYIYSSIKYIQLSNEIEEKKLKVCVKQKIYDCELISKYHEDCFKSSYRSEYRIRDFHTDEYHSCIDRKIKLHGQ